MLTRTLAQWLAHAERLHARGIDLGLERVERVRDRLARTVAPVVITVGGTNGKGSTCAMLERILLSAGYRVGLYSSPHLLAYNERVRVGGVDATDASLCAAFEAVENARGEVPLSYFEFGTLVAWQLFADQGVDVVVLEVGLGGRLDAVNVFEPDCAVVVSVGLDHMDYLGSTREDIGWEKAGIFRPGRPAVVGDPDPPRRLIEHAELIGAQLKRVGIDFGCIRAEQQWRYWSIGTRGRVQRGGLAYPALRGGNQTGNAAVALAALESLHHRLPVSMQEIRRGLAEVELAGRFQVLPGRPAIVLDVAHNPHAAAVLADNLGYQGFFHCTWAVFAMLGDKDIAGVVTAMRGRVDRWLLADLSGPRAVTAQTLRDRLEEQGVVEPAECFVSPAAALRSATERAGENDRILVFGSFLTVSDAMRAIRESR